MREIDINHVMHQLGITAVDFMNWPGEQQKDRGVEVTRILDLEPPVDTLTNSISSIEPYL